MRTLSLAKYELLPSVDDLLDPQTLSDLVRNSIKHVRRSPFLARPGASNNGFEWVTAVSNSGDEGHYVLKRIEFNNDWLMVASNDVLCRSVTLWQYGLLDRLSSHLDHTIVVCSHDGPGWAILMKDVSAGEYPTESSIASPHHIYRYLDALAFMHATFWEDESLADEHLGLTDNACLIQMTTVPTARMFAHVPVVIPGLVLEGWEHIQTMLEPGALEIYRELMMNPQPLFDAIARYPATLVHGDYRAGSRANLSYMADYPVSVCVLDWQFASYALMTVDLAWFSNRGTMRPFVPPHDATEYYRERLEHYLGFSFDQSRWQAMLDLGTLIDALRLGCIEAYFAIHNDDEEYRRRNRVVADGYNDQIRAGARWL